MSFFSLLPLLAGLANVDTSLFLPKDYLVEVQVDESRVGNDVPEVKLKILQVYSGPPELKGTTFFLNKFSINTGLLQQNPYPVYDAPIEKNEKSIILVRYDKDHVIDIAPRGSSEYRFIRFPIRDIKAETRFKQ